MSPTLTVPVLRSDFVIDRLFTAGFFTYKREDLLEIKNVAFSLVGVLNEEARADARMYMSSIPGLPELVFMSIPTFFKDQKGLDACPDVIVEPMLIPYDETEMYGVTDLRVIASAATEFSNVSHLRFRNKEIEDLWKNVPKSSATLEKVFYACATFKFSR